MTSSRSSGGQGHLEVKCQSRRYLNCSYSC